MLPCLASSTVMPGTPALCISLAARLSTLAPTVPAEEDDNEGVGQEPHAVEVLLDDWGAAPVLPPLPPHPTMRPTVKMAQVGFSQILLMRYNSMNPLISGAGQN